MSRLGPLCYIKYIKETKDLSHLYVWIYTRIYCHIIHIYTYIVHIIWYIYVGIYILYEVDVIIVYKFVKQHFQWHLEKLILTCVRIELIVLPDKVDIRPVNESSVSSPKLKLIQNNIGLKRMGRLISSLCIISRIIAKTPISSTMIVI